MEGLELAAEIIDGNGIANTLMAELKAKFQGLQDKTGKVPKLVIIRVGDDEGSRIYAEAKVKRSKKLGIDASVMHRPTITRDELVGIVKDLGSDPTVNGIMIENPLPKEIDFYEIADMIPFYKDVDGTSSANQGRIVNRKEFLTPATATAVVKIVEYYPDLARSTVAIVNRSPVVGRPLSQMLLNRDYTVSVVHTKTPSITAYTKRADIVVAAVGKAKYFDDEMVGPDSTLIDVGINYVDGQIVGDANFDVLSKWVKRITPVPGGVGAVTATLIFQNLLKAFEYQNSEL